MKDWVLVAQSCLILCDFKNCSLQGSSVHRILQARTLAWVAISFSRGTSWLKDQTRVSCISGRFFSTWVTREASTDERLILLYCWNEQTGAQQCPTPTVWLVLKTVDPNTLCTSASPSPLPPYISSHVGSYLVDCYCVLTCLLQPHKLGRAKTIPILSPSHRLDYFRSPR